MTTQQNDDNSQAQETLEAESIHIFSEGVGLSFARESKATTSSKKHDISGTEQKLLHFYKNKPASRAGENLSEAKHAVTADSSIWLNQFQNFEPQIFANE